VVPVGIETEKVGLIPEAESLCLCSHCNGFVLPCEVPVDVDSLLPDLLRVTVSSLQGMLSFRIRQLRCDQK